jgi:hypothetical protein
MYRRLVSDVDPMMCHSIDPRSVDVLEKAWLLLRMSSTAASRWSVDNSVGNVSVKHCTCSASVDDVGCSLVSVGAPVEGVIQVYAVCLPSVDTAVLSGGTTSTCSPFPSRSPAVTRYVIGKLFNKRS